MSSDPEPRSRPLLQPSQLGTKAYWDEVYARELTNHVHDADDEGTVWFDESGAEEAVVKLLDELAEDGLLRRSGSDASRILDLGTGNGHMLFALREVDEDDGSQGWQGEMLGVDYSPASVQLAQRINLQREIDPSITFKQWDLLLQESPEWQGDGFDLILDKGTFDAISLMPQPEGQPHSCEVYLDKVLGMMRPHSFLVVTSCNWTKEELVSWFTSTDKDVHLHLLKEARYPTFTFGGQTGQSIVTLVFRRSM